MNPQKTLATIVLAIAAIVAAAPAKADNIVNFNLTYGSGATFVGTVDFSDDYSQVNGVDGWLTGYQYGTTGYVGSGSDHIDWDPYPGVNLDGAGGDVFGTVLADGTPGAYYPSPGAPTNLIDFTYDYSSGVPVIVIDTADNSEDFSGAVPPNGIDFADPLANTTPTPEPDTLLLLGSGLVGLAGMVRRRLPRSA